MRILVTGASGFLGHHLVRSLQSSHQVVATWNTKPVQFELATSEPMDFTDPEVCRRVLFRHCPTHVVHAGAMTLTGECEKNPEAAHRVNVTGTANLLRAMAELAAETRRDSPFTRFPHLVYLSTDLVFNGRRPGGRYLESGTHLSERPDPLMVYGRTKLEAESLIIRASGTTNQTATILRSALIYGSPTAPGPCFLDWMIAGIRRGEGALFTDEYRSPVYVEDLCRLIETACEERANGIYHAGGPDRISRYEFGLLVAETFGLPPENVKGMRSADATTGSPRPADVSLDVAKARRELGYAPRTCREGLAEIRRQGFHALSGRTELVL